MTTTALSELAKKLFEAYSRNSGNPPDCHHDRNAAEQWMAQAMEECRLSSAEPVALGYVNPKDVADGTATLIWPKNLAAAAYVPVFAHAQPAALGTPLYHAANRLMLVIGHDGDISSRAPECDALMRVLRDIDGGEYKPAAKVEALCSDCPPAGYPTDATRCTPCPRNSPTPASVPDGYVMAPHFRGFAHLGLGQYRLFHSRAGSDAELSIVPATPDETAGRVVGDLRDDGPDEIPAELMAVRLRFENVAGLDALEQQLRLLRETHFSAPPTNQEGTTP